CCVCSIWLIGLFFFQAEDGIRDRNVTGVQTCALPISNKVRTAKVEATPSRTTKTAARVTNGQAGVLLAAPAGSGTSAAGGGEAADAPGGGPAGRSIVAS